MDPSDDRIPSTTAGGVPPCGIYVDEEGEWLHEGNRIIREGILDLFYENLTLAPDGTYLVQWNNSVCALDVADTVYIITSVDRANLEGSPHELIWLKFKHIARREPLDPGTLWVGRGNVLYCLVGRNRFPARFSRPAYYQLAAWVQEDVTSGQFTIELNGCRHVIKTTQVST